MKLKRINKITKKSYSGKVYDLAVDDNFTYNINGIVVHNSLCTTRIQTGHGIPNVSAIMDTRRANSDIPIIADGGIRSPGDVAKALAVGADSVMLGSLLAGTEETPAPMIDKGQNLYKRYRGSASLETKSTHGQALRNVEGESTVVPFKGGTKYAIYRLSDGLRSALSYSGTDNLRDYYNKSKWNIITNAGIQEAQPHLI